MQAERDSRSSTGWSVLVQTSELSAQSEEQENPIIPAGSQVDSRINPVAPPK